MVDSDTADAPLVEGPSQRAVMPTLTLSMPQRVTTALTLFSILVIL